MSTNLDLDTEMIQECNNTYLYPCKPCPSMQWPPDPEALDYLCLSRDHEYRQNFPCAWRRKGYCHGHAKQMSKSPEYWENVSKHLETVDEC